MTITVYVSVNDSAPYSIHTDDELGDAFDEFLDECYEPFAIAGTVIYPARALRECDPVAYREAFNNYTDEQYHELEMPEDMYVRNDEEEMDEWIAREIGDA